MYRGRDERTGGAVAIKELVPHGSLEGIERFRREARVLQQLDHPKIPDYIDAFVSGKGRARREYLVQELVDGLSLEEEMVLRRYRQSEVLGVIEELAEILAYLHGLSPPVIHRDIKPGNVMRRRDGTLVLVDFGAVLDEVMSTAGRHTVAGTFGYMAPEQFEGTAVPATDIFGLGALAVALLSRKDPADLLRGPEGSWRNAMGLSESSSVWLGRMLAFDPARRPTAEELKRLTAHVSVSSTALRAAPSGAARVPRDGPQLLNRWTAEERFLPPWTVPLVHGNAFVLFPLAALAGLYIAGFMNMDALEAHFGRLAFLVLQGGFVFSALIGFLLYSGFEGGGKRLLMKLAFRLERSRFRSYRVPIDTEAYLLELSNLSSKDPRGEIVVHTASEPPSDDLVAIEKALIRAGLVIDVRKASNGMAIAFQAKPRPERVSRYKTKSEVRYTKVHAAVRKALDVGVRPHARRLRIQRVEILFEQA
jgi:hypothetical protein